MAVEGYVASVVTRELNSHGEAVKTAEFIKNCPNALFVGVTGNKVAMVLMVPEESRPWANYSELFPESNSSTLMLEEVYYPNTRREVIKSDKPPCGFDCETCGDKESFNCRGCIAIRV